MKTSFRKLNINYIFEVVKCDIHVDSLVLLEKAKLHFFPSEFVTSF